MIPFFENLCGENFLHSFLIQIMCNSIWLNWGPIKFNEWWIKLNSIYVNLLRNNNRILPEQKIVHKFWLIALANNCYFWFPTYHIGEKILSLCNYIFHYTERWSYIACRISGKCRFSCNGSRWKVQEPVINVEIRIATTTTIRITPVAPKFRPSLKWYLQSVKFRPDVQQ